MMDYSKRRALIDYIHSTKNEIAIDRSFFFLANETGADLGYFPRVPFWLVNAKKNRKLYRFFYLVSRYGWLCGVGAIYFLIDLCSFILIKLIKKNNNKRIINFNDGAVLAFSSRAGDVIDPISMQDIPKQWLLLPWGDQVKLPSDAVPFELITVVNMCDLARSFIDAVRSIYTHVKYHNNLDWILQTYTAFRWFLVRRVVDRFAGKLVIVDHFDRWSILVDRSVKSSRSLNTSKSFSIVQHGTVRELFEASQYICNVKAYPTLLFNLNELYVYNKYEENIFKKKILSPKTMNSVVVKYFNPPIILTDCSVGTKKRLLFVGYPLCEEFQVLVYKRLILEIDAVIFYKAHPKSTMSTEICEVGWTVIEDVSVFPLVDLVVSYPSTLVVEYSGVGVQACVHPINADPNILEEFVFQISDRFRGLIN
jgi:hypothetical protein